MEIKYCANCMSTLPQYESRCPVCGTDNRAVVQPAHALRCNTILHRKYTVGKILGQGGFGITYLGRDLVLDMKVAIKEYFPANVVVRDTGSSDRILWNPSKAGEAEKQRGFSEFLKEARKLAKLDQMPAIVRVRDMFLENETAYIVMDYVEGVNLLQKLVDKGPMPFSDCVRLLHPVMEDLARAHRQGMIHRDISPDNIMIRADGSACLLDLGAAKDMTSIQDGSTQSVAKSGFSPKEQYSGTEPVGPWTDVYSLCATIYFCITGKRPPNALDRIKAEGTEFIGNLKKRVNKREQAILLKGLAVEQGERIQSVEELLESLKPPKPVTIGCRIWLWIMLVLSLFDFFSGVGSIVSEEAVTVQSLYVFLMGSVKLFGGWSLLFQRKKTGLYFYITAVIIHCIVNAVIGPALIESVGSRAVFGISSLVSGTVLSLVTYLCVRKNKEAFQ